MDNSEADNPWYHDDSPALMITKRITLAKQNFDLADRLVREGLNSLPETAGKQLANIHLATAQLWLAQALKESKNYAKQVNDEWYKEQNYKVTGSKAGVHPADGSDASAQ